MANRFNYESPIDRLLSVTLPQFVSKERDREESSRRFDRQMDADADIADKSQENFDKKFDAQEKQNKLVNERSDRVEARNEDKERFESIIKITTISGRKKAIETEGLIFGTNLYKNKLKVASNELDTISEKNKGIANIYREISPQLGALADSQIDNIDLNIDDDVLNYLKIQGASNAQRGAAIIANFKEASKNSSEVAQRLSVKMATPEEFASSKATLVEAQSMLNSYINSEPVMGGKINPNKGTVITSSPGTIDNPYIKTPGFDNSVLKEGDIVKAGADGKEQLLIFTSEGDFLPVTTSTPDDIEYKEEPKTNFFELEPSAEELNSSTDGSALSRLSSAPKMEPGGMDFFSSPNLDFMRNSSAAEESYGTGSGGVLSMGGSTKEQVTAVRRAENNTKEIVKNLQRDFNMMTTGIPSSKRPPKEQANAKMNNDNSTLQEYIKDMYSVYISTDEGTKPGKIIKNRLKKALLEITKKQKAVYFNKETKSLLNTLEL